MRRYTFDRFDIDALHLDDVPTPLPGPGEVRLDVHAASLNYRDILVLSGTYNPKLKLPATLLSDAAGVVGAVGSGVTRVKVGDRVTTHFIADWLDGPGPGDVSRDDPRHAGAGACRRTGYLARGRRRADAAGLRLRPGPRRCPSPH